MAKIVAPKLGTLTGAKGTEIKIDFSLLTAASVLFDAVYVPGGEQSVAALLAEADAIHFVNEAYKHCKTIAASGAGAELLNASYISTAQSNAAGKAMDGLVSEPGVVIGSNGQAGKIAAEFINAIAQHRHWERETKGDVPA